MSREFLGGPFRHGLTFIATLAFVASFFGSRLFATLFPNTVVMQGGIHLHHFWYGIALISVAGWMGIAWRNERLYRLYAVLYGLGAGFVGDEVGLLLTFNNYQSELTYLFFIAAISFVIIATLFLRYRAQLQEELLKLSLRERVAMVGVYLTGDRKSTRLNSCHLVISYAVFCLKKKKITDLHRSLARVPSARRALPWRQLG